MTTKKTIKRAPKPRHRGRKTILNAKMIENIALMIRSGAYVYAACAAVGISEAAYHKWINKGEDELARRTDEDDPVVDKSQQVYVDFVEAITRAEALAEIEATNRIRKLATAVEGKNAVDPRVRLEADKFFLERRYRDRWGRSSNHTGKVEVEQSGKIEVENTGNTPIVFRVPVPEGMRRIHDLEDEEKDDE